MPVSLDTLAAFLFTSLVIELTPGPNMAYLAMVSAVEGRRAGFAATTGIALGLWLGVAWPWGGIGTGGSHQQF
jgi:threonine/homoserine/homoserine lactone efflux protein